MALCVLKSNWQSPMRRTFLKLYHCPWVYNNYFFFSYLSGVINTCGVRPLVHIIRSLKKSTPLWCSLHHNPGFWKAQLWSTWMSKAHGVTGRIRASQWTTWNQEPPFFPELWMLLTSVLFNWHLQFLVSPRSYGSRIFCSFCLYFEVSLWIICYKMKHKESTKNKK